MFSNFSGKEVDIKVGDYVVVRVVEVGASTFFATLLEIMTVCVFYDVYSGVVWF